MRRRDWVDPAPLEVDRPRLPWWTLLPNKLLAAASPVILAGLLVWLVVYVVRRLYRYPVLITVSVAAAVSVWAYGWLRPALLLGCLGMLGAVWWRVHPSSFERVVWRQVRSEYRRLGVYAFRWRRTMVFADLDKTVRRSVFVPRLCRVRSDGWRDRVTVKLLPGQSPTLFAMRAEALAHSFGATSCRVRTVKPRRIVLDLVHANPLTRAIEPPALPAEHAGSVDLRKLTIGRSETGRPWRVRLVGNHLLVAGSTGAGKASVAWSLLWALAPAIRSGLVQVFGIDPKGGMELGKAPDVFTRLVCTNGPDAVELLEHVATLVRQRAEGFRQQGRRSWSPDSGAPFVLLVVDELADVIAYQPDRKLRERANLALQVIASQGRAPGVAVLGELQDPRKSVVDFRHLFPVRVALRLDEPTQVDMVLGDGVRDRGATAHEVPESTPGVAWVKVDGQRDPDRVRAFHITDTHLDTLTAYLVEPVAAAGSNVRQLPSVRGGDAA